MNNTNKLLSILLLAQAAIFGSIYLFSSDSDSARTAPVLLLAGLERDELSEIVLEDDDGKSLKLTRVNEQWILPDQGGHPTDMSKVDKLLGSLLGMESGYIVSKSSAHHFELKVDEKEFERKVILESKKAKLTLLVGTQGSGGFTHVRINDKPEVYAVDDLDTWKMSTAVSSWAKLEVLKVDKTRLASLEIEGPKGKIELSRASLHAWHLDGQPIEESKLDDLLDQVTQIELSDVVGKWSDKESQDTFKTGMNPTKITLALAKDPLPENPPPPEPQPASDGGPDGDQNGDGGSSNEDPKAQESTKAIEIEIAERKQIQLAGHPGKELSLMLYLEGSPYLVLVDRYKMDKFTDLSATKLREGDSPPEPPQ